MATPAQVPAPPQPRAAYVWLMRGGCYIVCSVFAVFAWHVPDSILLDVLGICLFLGLGLGKPSERRLKSAMNISVLALAIMGFALVFPIFTDATYERIEWALLAGVNVALIGVIVSALLAYRSVPKEVWVAQRPVAPPLDRTQLDLKSSMIARAAALAAIAVVSYAAVDTHVGFIFFAFLFAIPYLVFAVAPVRAAWVAWGKALAWCVGIPFLIASGLAVAQFFTGGHVTRSGRYFTVFVLTVFAMQVAQWFFVRRAYPLHLPIAREVGQSILYFAIVLLFLAATLPDFYPNRKGSSESSAAGSLRTINTAAYTYQQQFPDVGYPPGLKVLGACSNPATSNPATKDAACLVDTNLGCPAPACIKSGYRFTYKPVMKDGVVVHYSVVARPVEYEETGIRSFYTDDSAIIRSTNDDREATAADPPLD